MCPCILGGASFEPISGCTALEIEGERNSDQVRFPKKIFPKATLKVREFLPLFDQKNPLLKEYSFDLMQKIVSQRKSASFHSGYVDISLGQIIPAMGGRLFASIIQTNDLLGKDKSLFTVGFNQGFFSVKDEKGQEYKKIVLRGDFISGSQVYRRKHLGVYYYLTPDISISTGPVWVKNQSILSKSLWGLQFTFNIPLLPK